MRKDGSERKLSDGKDILAGIDFDSPDYDFEKLTDAQKKVLMAESDKWIADHTFNVTVTTIYTTKTLDSKTKELQVETIYQSNDSRFKEMFESDVISEVNCYPIESNEKQVYFEDQLLSLEEDVSLTNVNKEMVVMASPSDPYKWWKYYTYPQHMWYIISGVCVRKDPINMIWDNTSSSLVKNNILAGAGNWTGVVTVEYRYEILDRNGI
ncbi:hypothetical protein [Methanolapillus ohkumae]|uniref:Uncharacterized protein n=1 Tax=Methanolapillus ohkumae TaxID=3028298 RepID=A0AA96VH82_9EURY|nr:hypothetical protein MsAm2_02540 [Methanosarcinaceae archaeon Am2]